MKHYTLTSATLLCLLALSSCQDRTNNSRGTDLSTVKWERVERQKSFTPTDLKERDLGPSFKADISLTFPVMKGEDETAPSRAFLDSVSVALQKRLLPAAEIDPKSPTLSVDKFIDQRRIAYLSELESTKKEGYSEELLNGFVHEFIIRDSITYEKNNLFSLQTLYYEYSGGAHGLQTTTAYTFDFTKETTLTPDLLFKPGSISKIDSLILRNIVAQNEVNTPDELEELGFFNYTDAKTTDNMLLTSDGVTFIYNPYEIAAYVVGTVRVVLPYSTISSYLSDDYAFLRP